jgi:hypothetical protein
MAQQPMVTDANFYRLANGPVALRVVIGDAQVGASSLTLDGKPIAFDNQTGSAPIGDGPNLANSILRCVTIVHDTNAATNKTSVTYTLEGGLVARTFFYEFTVAQEKDSVHYVVSFIFVA